MDRASLAPFSANLTPNIAETAEGRLRMYWLALFEHTAKPEAHDLEFYIECSELLKNIKVKMPEHLSICSSNDMSTALSAAGAGPMHLAFLRKLLQDIHRHGVCQFRDDAEKGIEEVFWNQPLEQA